MQFLKVCYVCSTDFGMIFATYIYKPNKLQIFELKIVAL